MADHLVDRSERQSAASQFDGVSTTFGPFGFEIFDVLDVVAETREIGTTTWFLDGAATFAKGPASPDTFSVTFDQAHPVTHEYRVRGKRTHERSVALATGTSLSLDALALVEKQVAFVLQEIRRDLDNVDGTAAQGAAFTAVAARDIAVQAQVDAEAAKTAIEGMSAALAELDAGTFTSDLFFQGAATFQGGMTLPERITVPQNFFFTSGNSVELRLNKTANGQLARLWGLTDEIANWAVDLGDTAGDFVVKRYDPITGNFVANALKIFNATGQALLDGELTFPSDDMIAWNIGITLRVGNGSPEGVVEANVGSMYLRRDGIPGQTQYIKESGSGLTTGWVAK